MLIGYGQPAGITITASGAAIANAAAAVDGQPSSIARITGGAGSASLRADWTGAAPIRVVAALGLTCDAGTALALTGKRSGDSGYPYALGGNATTQTVVQLPDGSRAAWFVLPAGNTPLVGLQLQVADGEFDVGELVVMRGVEVKITKDWTAERIDPSLRSRTIGSQINTVRRRSYRRLSCQFSMATLAEVRGGGLGGIDWELLEAAVQGAERCVAIPRRLGVGGALDPSELHRTAVYGMCALSGTRHLAGPWYSKGATFEEAPPL